MKLCIVADWLPTYAGAEHVVAAFHRIWPTAPIFTTVARHGSLGPLDTTDIRTTGLQKWYKILGKHQLLLPFMPRALEQIDLSGYDVILSSSHAVGKGIIPPSSAVHVCYCHTPMRYGWEMEEQYLNDFHVHGPLRKLARSALKKLRRWDQSSTKRVDTFLANSQETKERIARIYGRDSTVVRTPVDDRFFAPSLTKKEKTHFLAIGRLVPYKRFDLLVELANALQLPLIIAGTGSEEAKLKSMAGPTVQFLGFVPDADLPSLYQNARAVLCPQIEDAGIVPIEALASGTPVIALGKGGVLDILKNEHNGILVPEQTVDAFLGGLERFSKYDWKPEVVRKSVEHLSETAFAKAIQAQVEAAFKAYH